MLLSANEESGKKEGANTTEIIRFTMKKLFRGYNQANFWVILKFRKLIYLETLVHKNKSSALPN